MKFLWCDIETTGLEVEKHKPIQIAFIFVSTQIVNGVKVQDETKRIYYLNPFDIPDVELDEKEVAVHGYTREKIETFEKSAESCKKIEDFLNSMENFRNTEKMFFCGYNSDAFDWTHLVDLFKRHNMDFTKHFMPVKLDVYNQVKKAVDLGKLAIPNKKLVTVAEKLGIDLTNAHDAMGDITATREVAKSLAKLGISLQ